MNRMMSFAAALGMVLASAAGRTDATEYIFATIHYPGASYTHANGINDSGQIVGWYHVGGKSHGFTLSGGVYTSFDYPTAASGGSGAYGINNSGQIVGWYDTVGSNNLAAYLRDGDEYHALTAFGSDWTEAWGINDTATVVGWYRYGADVYRGFLFDGTSYTTIDDTEAVTTYAKDINNDGVIVGSGWESAGYPHAFIREADGTFSTYFVFGYPADANGINDLGQIVGDYGPSPDELYGYVLSGGIGATPEMLEVPGGTDTIALDINNLGQVVGRYLNASSLGRGFLATPIPEVAGDYNRNGVVDAADYTVWRDTLGRSVARYTGADGNGDGYVDNWDYGAWKDNFGATANSGLGATQSAGADAGVPEPASLALILAATTMLWSRRPSKRRS